MNFLVGPPSRVYELFDPEVVADTLAYNHTPRVLTEPHFWEMKNSKPSKGVFVLSRFSLSPFIFRPSARFQKSTRIDHSSQMFIILSFKSAVSVRSLICFSMHVPR